jgi:hypothetical protein
MGGDFVFARKVGHDGFNIALIHPHDISNIFNILTPISTNLGFARDDDFVRRLWQLELPPRLALNNRPCIETIFA